MLSKYDETRKDQNWGSMSGNDVSVVTEYKLGWRGFRPMVLQAVGARMPERLRRQKVEFSEGILVGEGSR